MVGTYTNGKYAVPLRTVKAAFPGAKLVRINVTGDPSTGDCLDIERFDATPEDIPGWAHARQAAGISNLATYCNRDTFPAVQQVCQANGLALYHWIATLDGTLLIPGYVPWQGPAAVQFTNTGQTDVSLVYEDSWHP